MSKIIIMMSKFTITIKYAIKIYLISTVSMVVSLMFYFLGYAVTLVIMEGLIGSQVFLQTWIGILAGILAVIVFLTLWISLFYLGNIWQTPLNNTVKFLVGTLSVFAAIFTIFIFAVYLTGIA